MIAIEVDSAPGKAQQIWRQETPSGRIEMAISQVDEARLGTDLLAGEAESVQGHRTAVGRAPGAVAPCADHIARAIGDQTDATQGIVTGEVGGPAAVRNLLGQSGQPEDVLHRSISDDRS